MPDPALDTGAADRCSAAGVAAQDAPLPWIRRWSHLVADGATVLDVACGAGRHLRWFASRGCRVTGVDRDARATGSLRPLGELIVADIESGPWPFAGRQFDAVIVTQYLWRPLLPRLIESLAPAGVLLYETFAVGQETIGRPSNPDFLLRPGELLDAARSLRVVAFEDGYIAEDGSDEAAGVGRDRPSRRACRFTQRIAAIRLAASTADGKPQASRCALG